MWAYLRQRRSAHLDDASNGISEEYSYDNASQFTAITVKNGATVLGDLTYGYDKSGRRTKMGGSFARTLLPQPLGGATYNATNRATQSGGTTLTHDANGNLTNDGTNTYTWNALTIDQHIRRCQCEFSVRRVWKTRKQNHQW